MTYPEICKQNKLLHGELEQNTYEIALASVRGDIIALDELYDYRRGLNILLEISLDNLENSLNISKARAAERIEREKMILASEQLSSRELKIIRAYRDNYDKSACNIANITGSAVGTVNRTITKYLSKKLGLVA